MYGEYGGNIKYLKPLGGWMIRTCIGSKLHRSILIALLMTSPIAIQLEARAILFSLSSSPVLYNKYTYRVLPNIKCVTVQSYLPLWYTCTTNNLICQIYAGCRVHIYTSVVWHQQIFMNGQIIVFRVWIQFSIFYSKIFIQYATSTMVKC